MSKEEPDKNQREGAIPMNGASRNCHLLRRKYGTFAECFAADKRGEIAQEGK